jgi:hypothetical protein
LLILLVIDDQSVQYIHHDEGNYLSKAGEGK